MSRRQKARISIGYVDFRKQAEHLADKIANSRARTTLYMKRGEDWSGDNCVLPDNIMNRVKPDGKVLYVGHFLYRGGKIVCVWYEEGSEYLLADFHEKGKCPHCDYYKIVDKRFIFKETFTVKLKADGAVTSSIDGSAAALRQMLINKILEALESDESFLMEQMTEVIDECLEDDVFEIDGIHWSVNIQK